MKLSLIVPAYNEEASLPMFLKSLSTAIASQPIDYEIIVVNDGSKDDTLAVAQRSARNDRRLRVLNLSRNFGKEIATSAGIAQATGDALIMIDADGQHPVEMIGEFLRLWQAGYQVVVGVRRTDRHEGIIKHYGSKLFYRLFNATTDITLIPGATDFRLIDRQVRDELVKFTERNRITRGLIDWMGFKRTTVYFDAHERMAGKPSYNVAKLFNLTLNSFVSLSIAPLYAIGVIGVSITFFAFLIGAFTVTEQLLLRDPLHLHISGTAMISLLILFLTGIMMTAQGLLALYLSRMHIEVQNRPLFIIDRANSVNI